jgi:aspartate/methionine/tyrosine aminotransferase
MERMQSRFENYVDYNLSESGVDAMTPEDLLPDEHGRAALLKTRLTYCQSNGTEELRDRIAAFYDGATRDNVLVTNGGSEANYATFWSLLEPGDRVAYMLPNYLQTLGLARAWAGRADVFRLRPQDDPAGGRRWGLDIDELRRAVTPRTKLILVTNPNNPTGAVLTTGEMDEIVRVARHARAFIVADEIYRGAELSGQETPSFWGRSDKVIVTSGLSKAFGLPGLRIGWVVGPRALVERVWSYRDYTTIAPGTLSELLARRAMEPRRRQAIFERTRAILRRNWPVLEGWLAEQAHSLSYVAPCAGAIVLARHDLPIASTLLAERLRKEKSVLVVPGDQLGAPHHLRIGFGYGGGDGTMIAGLARIAEMIGELRRQPRTRPAGATGRAPRAAVRPRGSGARPRGRTRGR